VKAWEPLLPASPVTSAAGNAGGTTAEINALAYRPDDSFVNTHWLVLPDGPQGTGSLEVQRVSAFDQADGSGKTIITVSEAFTAQVASAVKAYISPIHPELVRLALNQAAKKIWPQAHVPRRYHHVSKSRVFNGFFDFWTGTLPEWWDRSNSGLAVTKDYDSYFGEHSAKLVADGSARYLLTKPVMPWLLNELNTYAVTLHAWIRATAASKLGVSISDGAGDGATVYHSGSGAWAEVVTASRTMAPGRPSAPVEFRVHCAASATGWVGPVWTEGGPEQVYVPIPPAFRRGPSRVQLDTREWPTHRNELTDFDHFRVESRYPAADRGGTLTIGNTVRFPQTITVSPRLMVLEGEDYVGDATSETDVYEIDSPYDELLYLAAIIELKRELADSPASGAQPLQQALKRDWQADYRELADQLAMPKAPITIGGGLGRAGIGRSVTWSDER
jgi:hypothetical protein